MTFQYSVAVRNARLDQVQTAVGTSPILKIFSGSEPVDCSQPDPSGLLATITLPVVWMNPAASGVKTLAGTWSGLASANGTVSCWRIYEATGTVCHIQGNTNDMTFLPTTFILGRSVVVTAFQLTSGNA